MSPPAPSYVTIFSTIQNMNMSLKGKNRFLLQKTTRLSDVNLEMLKNLGIQGIILDLDNTIVSEDDRYLSPNSEDWIEKAKQSGFKLFILSNGNRKWRTEFWSRRLDIPATAKARKPFPHEFRRAIAHMGTTANQVVVIGDSLHTDVIGAWISGCLAVQVATLPHKQRWWEKLAGRWIQFPYISSDLVDFDVIPLSSIDAR